MDQNNRLTHEWRYSSCSVCIVAARKTTGKHSTTHSSTSSFKITTTPTTRLLTSTSTTRLPKKTTTATATAANVNKNRQLRPVTSSSVHTTATKPNSTRLFKMDDKLLQEYLQRLSGIKPRGRNYRNISCPLTLEDKLKNGNPCFDENCSSTFPVPAERLRMMLQSHDILSAQFAEVIDSLANESQRADFIFLTAASSNHYGETQATIKGLQEIIFPMLHKHFPGNTTRLVYFDLGLRKLQTDLLRKYGKCDVIAFPFDKLPPNFRKLSTCSWKPLLLKAYLKYSRLTVWMDSSTRIIEKSSLAFLSVVQRALADGMVISRTQNMLARHVAQPISDDEEEDEEEEKEDEDEEEKDDDDEFVNEDDVDDNKSVVFFF
ncbi:hypothetical protein C0Q70_16099 [Pomacea canaliculata]|uniref:Uncharacterized protein n=1 Tax=Pomacea canaliculata TaxID=400727 RepID=A0A2T7NNU2_POMCA|nr:hypothetical protein C0Q70_16099 [Pomacea canaliculata]